MSGPVHVFVDGQVELVVVVERDFGHLLELLPVLDGVADRELDAPQQGGLRRVANDLLLGDVRFIDTVVFMVGSLYNLVKNFYDPNDNFLIHMLTYFGDHM